MSRKRVSRRRPIGRRRHLKLKLEIEKQRAGAPVDTLVPDRIVQRELNVTAMTTWRWDQRPELAALGWPEVIRIRGRKYRSRERFEKFKQRLFETGGEAA